MSRMVFVSYVLLASVFVSTGCSGGSHSASSDAGPASDAGVGRDASRADAEASNRCRGVTCTANGPCSPAGVCDPRTGECSHPVASDESACDDGDGCTVADVCRSGVCTAGTPRDCDDGNPCTADACAAGGCTHAPVEGACNPPTGLRILHAALDSGTGTTHVVIGFEPSVGRLATRTRIARAERPEGPWTTLADVPLEQSAYADDMPSSPSAYYRVTTLADPSAHEGERSTVLHVHALAAAEYDLPDHPVGGLTLRTRLHGLVRHPRALDGDAFPLVMLVHGNHGICRDGSGEDVCPMDPNGPCPPRTTPTPNAAGLLYLAETLAAQGLVVVSVDANTLNCLPSAILARGRLVLEHLRSWRAWNETGGAPFDTRFVRHVDLSRIGLVGHSRGGDAVAHVPELLAGFLTEGDAALSGVVIRSSFAIAPTDFSEVPMSGIGPADLSHVTYGVLLAGCDGDVCTQQGLHTYDRALASRTRARTQLLYVGAIHNHFNTSWPPENASCPAAELTSATQQRGLLEAMLGSWMTATLAPSPAELEPFMRAEGELPGAIASWAGGVLDLRWSHAARSRTLVDDAEGAAAPMRNVLGELNTFTGFSVARACVENACDTAFDHDKGAFFLSWEAGAPKIASFGTAGLDVAEFTHLSMRAATRISTLNAVGRDQRLRVRLTDRAGLSATVFSGDFDRLYYPVTSASCGRMTAPPREILHTVRVPFAAFLGVEPRLDLHALAAIEIEAGVPGAETGSVLISDVEVSE